MGIERLERPELDYTGHTILSAYFAIEKSRRLVEFHPLPLCVRDINDYLAGHPLPFSRYLIDSCIFALDQEFFRSNAEKDTKTATNKKNR